MDTITSHRTDSIQTALKDKLQRSLHDLRISVIDRCNFRCRYCMPEEEYAKNYTFLKENEWLNYDEIERLTKLFVNQGISKVRLTGGEPLLRPNLTQLITKLSAIDGIRDLALTTNGLLLGQYAKALKEAGLDRITISLDTLNEKIFKEMSGDKGDVQTILDNIKMAENSGFNNMKINVVVQRGVNDHTILDLVEHFKGTGHILRFIEYMDVGNCNHWQLNNVVSSSEIQKRIHEKYPLKPSEENYYGEVASRYKFVDGSGEIGFISSVTQPFCKTCTRARLSTDGKIYTCLFSSRGIDIRTALRSGLTDGDLIYYIQKIWSEREDRYSELRSKYLTETEPRHKVEMFQIGG